MVQLNANPTCRAEVYRHQSILHHFGTIHVCPICGKQYTQSGSGDICFTVLQTTMAISAGAQFNLAILWTVSKWIDFFLLLGFGPFSTHVINASWVAVKEMDATGGLGEDINLVTLELPVCYEKVLHLVPELWRRHQPKVVAVIVLLSGQRAHLPLSFPCQTSCSQA